MRSYEDFRGQGAAIHDCGTGHCKEINKRTGGGRVRMHVMVAEMVERSDVQTEGAPRVRGCTIHVRSCTVVNAQGRHLCGYYSDALEKPASEEFAAVCTAALARFAKKCNTADGRFAGPTLGFAMR